MKKIAFLLSVFSISLASQGQSKTTEALLARFDEKLSLYFYKNTLRMLNQQENKEFDELIKNVDKMRFLMVNKDTEKFGPEDYSKLTMDYKKESYDPIVTSRIEGRNFDIFLKETNGSTKGTVVLVNDSTNLYVLDIIGSIDVSKAGSLFSMIDSSTDIGKKIRNFSNQESDSTRRSRKNRHND